MMKNAIMESLYETNTCRIWAITLQGLFCVCNYFRVNSLSNNGRLLHKHLLWQGHNLVIGAWSGVDYCLWSVKIVLTKHNTCPLSAPRWWEAHQTLSLQLMVESQTSTEAARLMMAPGITSQRETEQWFGFQTGIRIVQKFYKMSFIQCMT